MKNGEVLVWWPTTGALAETISAEFNRMDDQSIGRAEAKSDAIPCHTWNVVIDPVVLPSLPPLPDITNSGEDFQEQPPRLIEIGGMDSAIVGLTNHGHVLKFRGLDHEEAIGTTGWQYVCPQPDSLDLSECLL